MEFRSDFGVRVFYAATFLIGLLGGGVVGALTMQ